jgi:hypothetical protein
MTCHVAGPAITVAETAPWWGIPVIAGCFLLAVALSTFLANLTLKRLELARGDRAKWDQEILDRALGIKKLCDEMAAVGTESHAAYKENITHRLPVYVANLKALRTHVETLTLIGSENLSKAATMLMISAMNTGLAHDYSHLPPKEQKQKQKAADRIPELSQASKTFNEAVRKELRAKR